MLRHLLPDAKRLTLLMTSKWRPVSLPLCHLYCYRMTCNEESLGTCPVSSSADYADSSSRVIMLTRRCRRIEYAVILMIPSTSTRVPAKPLLTVAGNVLTGTDWKFFVLTKPQFTSIWCRHLTDGPWTQEQHLRRQRPAVLLILKQTAIL